MACAEFTTADGLFQILSRRFVDEEGNKAAEKRVITQYKYVHLYLRARSVISRVNTVY